MKGPDSPNGPKKKKTGQKKKRNIDALGEPTLKKNKVEHENGKKVVEEQNVLDNVAYYKTNILKEEQEAERNSERKKEEA